MDSFPSVASPAWNYETDNQKNYNEKTHRKGTVYDMATQEGADICRAQ